MDSKFVFLLAFVAAVVSKTDEYDPHPRYKYSYDVEDKLTGDSKSQNEQRNGDVVQGEYSLVDADGYKRTVKYTADDHSGFTAVVERVPMVQADRNLPAFAAEYFEAPTIQKSAIPLARFSEPIDSIEHATKAVVPTSQYASGYTSYDAPIYLKYDLLGRDQH